MAQPKLSRRKFMMAVGAGGAAGVAAVATKGIQQETSGNGSAQKKRQGYELSEHVRKYYRTTLV